MYEQFIYLNIKKMNNPIKKWTEDLNRYFSKEDIWIANKHVKRCSPLLIIREMQIKTTMRNHLISVGIAIIKKSVKNSCWRRCREKREAAYTVGGNVSWCSHYGEQYENFLKKTKNRVTSNPILGHISQDENYNSKRYMHPNDHSSTIYNS